MNLSFIGKLTVVLLTVIVFFKTSFAQEHLFPMQKNFKWGFINKTGEWVIKPRFWRVSEFHDGVAAVYITHKQNNRQAQQQKKEKDNQEHSREGERDHAEAANNQRGWHLIDRAGDYITDKPFYVNAWIPRDHRPNLPDPAFEHFSEGLVVYENTYYNYAGEKVIEFSDCKECSDLGPFSEGLAAVNKEYTKGGYRDRKDQFGYINKKGEWVIEPQYTDAKRFSDGLAPVQKGDKWGAINKKGKVVVPFQYEKLGLFKKGVTWFEVHQEDDFPKYNGELGLINVKGEVVNPPVFDKLWNMVEHFSNGMLPVEASYRNLIYLNAEGEQEIPQTYKSAHSFSDGLALVEMDKTDIYAGRKLKEPIEGKFFIDTKGQIQIDDEMLDTAVHVWPFKNGLARIGFGLAGRGTPTRGKGEYKFVQKGYYGYINKEGEFVKIQSEKEVKYMKSVLDSVVEAKKRAEERRKQQALAKEKAKLKDCPDQLSYGNTAHKNTMVFDVLGYKRTLHFEDVVIIKTDDGAQTKYLLYFPPFGLNMKQRQIANQSVGGGFFSSITESYMDDFSWFVLGIEPNGRKGKQLEFKRHKLVHLDCMNKIQDKRFDELWNDQTSTRKATLDRSKENGETVFKVNFEIASKKHPEHKIYGSVKTTQFHDETGLQSRSKDLGKLNLKGKGNQKEDDKAKQQVKAKKYKNTEYFPHMQMFRYPDRSLMAPYETIPLPEEGKSFHAEHKELYSYVYQFDKLTKDEVLIKKNYFPIEEYFPEFNQELFLRGQKARDEQIMDYDFSNKEPTEIIYSSDIRYLPLKPLIFETDSKFLTENPKPVPFTYQPQNWDEKTGRVQSLPKPGIEARSRIRKIDIAYEAGTNKKAKSEVKSKLEYVLICTEGKLQDKKAYKIEWMDDRNRYESLKIWEIERKMNNQFTKQQRQALYKFVKDMRRKMKALDREERKEFFGSEKGVKFVKKRIEPTGIEVKEGATVQETMDAIGMKMEELLGQKDAMEGIHIIMQLENNQKYIPFFKALQQWKITHSVNPETGQWKAPLKALCQKQEFLKTEEIEFSKDIKAAAKGIKKQLKEKFGNRIVKILSAKGKAELYRPRLWVDAETGKPLKRTFYHDLGRYRNNTTKVAIHYQENKAKISARSNIQGKDKMEVELPKGTYDPLQFESILTNLPLKKGHRDSLQFFDLRFVDRYEFNDEEGKEHYGVKFKPDFFKATLKVGEKKKIKVFGGKEKVYPVEVHFDGPVSNMPGVRSYKGLNFDPEKMNGYAVYYVTSEEPSSIVRVDLGFKQLFETLRVKQ